jgi:branched-chain amino acid transport system permease protein
MKKIPSEVIIGILALLLPLAVGHNGYMLRILIMILYFAIAAYAWDQIGGYAGQISIGQAAFFAIGAYSVAILYTQFKLNTIAGILIGTIVAGVFALIIGVIVLKLRGPYFTLSTLALAEIVRMLLLYFKKSTGGAEGIFLPYDQMGFSFSTLQFKSNIPYYYIGLGLFIVAFCVSSYVRNSRFGYQLSALRNDYDAAESIGINAMKVKVSAYVISAVLTALAGGFYMVLDRYVDPTSSGGVNLSVQILLITLVGGRRSKWGPLMGSIILIPLIEFTNTFFGSLRAGLPMLVYSVILIVVVVYAPEGIHGLLQSIAKTTHWSWLKKTKSQGR